jgi:hypothetical protein
MNIQMFVSFLFIYLNLYEESNFFICFRASQTFFRWPFSSFGTPHKSVPFDPLALQWWNFMLNLFTSLVKLHFGKIKNFEKVGKYLKTSKIKKKFHWTPNSKIWRPNLKNCPKNTNFVLFLFLFLYFHTFSTF